MKKVPLFAENWNLLVEDCSALLAENLIKSRTISQIHADGPICSRLNWNLKSAFMLQHSTAIDIPWASSRCINMRLLFHQNQHILAAWIIFQKFLLRQQRRLKRVHNS